MDSFELKEYRQLLREIKAQVRSSQQKAIQSVNATMIQMYWQIGCLIDKRQKEEGWGAAIIPRLAADLKNDLPDQNGFSVRNLKYMISFYREYPLVQPPVAQLIDNAKNDINCIDNQEITKVQPTVAQLNYPDISLIFMVSWSHNVVLLERVKNMDERFWYMRQAIEESWTRNTLLAKIKNNAYARHGNKLNNFPDKLTVQYAEEVRDNLKDPYIFDFLTIGNEFSERELEAGLTEHIQHFLLELGQGFAFVGRQYTMTLDNQDFVVDMLFYHLKLRCYVVIELKKGKFLPEYAGKINFYCNLVDAQLKHSSDQPTIGLILCQDKNRIIAEYALKNIEKPIGISEYELSKELPEKLKSTLPSIEAIEAELSQNEEYEHE